MLLFLTTPLCLLSFILAYLTWRKASYRHTLAFGSFGVFMLLISVGMFWASYYGWEILQAELERMQGSS